MLRSSGEGPVVSSGPSGVITLELVIIGVQGLEQNWEVKKFQVSAFINPVGLPRGGGAFKAPTTDDFIGKTSFEVANPSGDARLVQEVFKSFNHFHPFCPAWLKHVVPHIGSSGAKMATGQDSWRGDRRAGLGPKSDSI